MPFPNLFKLEKLKISAFEDVERTKEKEIKPAFEAMFNPQSQSYGIRYKHGRGLWGATQSATFVREDPSSLRLTLLLDGTGVEKLGLVNLISSPQTVQDRIEHFLNIAYRSQSPTHEPSFLTVKWGALDFPCRLTSVTINYTSFDRDGSALRAELDITLALDEEFKKQQARLSFSSPDVSHARVVRGGDTLPLMTQAVYGSMAPLLRVARVNGLDHIRGLAPGQTLIFPPLAR
jgi:nucleoid-associated protein YgaU